MIRKLRFCSMALAICLATAVARDGSGQTATGDDEGGATKLLDENPELRDALAKSKVFKALKKSLPKAEIGEKTYYFAEGDLRLDEDQLLLYSRERGAQMRRYEEAKLGALPAGVPLPGQLTADAVNGRILRWPPGSTLTYCVLKSTFTEPEYNTVVANLKAAGDEWANTCNIKFEHKSGLDNSPDTDGAPPAGVLFYVKKTRPLGGVIASAFFPSSPASERKLLVFPFYFQGNMPYDRVGTFRHELGHILCFRHEHIRSEAPPVCATGETLDGAIPLTAYDPSSVMHYFCPDGDVGDRRQAITDNDKAGARQIYPASGRSASAEADSAFRNVAP